jgi:hypothetical protein
VAPDTSQAAIDPDFWNWLDLANSCIGFPDRTMPPTPGQIEPVQHRNRRGQYPYKRLAGWTQDEYRAFRKKKGKKSASDRRISQKAAKERRRAFARDQRRNHG